MLSISRFSPLTPALSQREREYLVSQREREYLVSQREREYLVSPRPLGEGRG